MKRKFMWIDTDKGMKKLYIKRSFKSIIKSILNYKIGMYTIGEMLAITTWLAFIYFMIYLSFQPR